jgi:hypothetical protein
MKKKVLIVALNEKWTGISRLPSGLTRVGFETYAVCPKNSFLAKTKFLKGTVLFPTFTYARSKIVYLWIIYSLFKIRPDLIIPGDEDTILALQNINKLLDKVPLLNAVSRIISDSMSPKKFDKLIMSKSAFQKKCNEWGILAPKNIFVHSSEEALKAAEEIGFPIVIKKDSGYGGSGVFICENRNEMLLNLKLIENVKLLDVVKSYLKRLFFVSVVNNEGGMSIQQFIKGTSGLTPFCAEGGTVYGYNQMLRLRTYPGKTGPASVSEGYYDEEIEKSVRKIASELSFTGFASFEFIVEEKSKKAFAVEFNARPTPSCHMDSTAVVNDLCECFYNGLNRRPIEKKAFRSYTIAMYPGEKRRDPNSPFLNSAFHDVPLQDPNLLAAIEAH